MSLSLLVILCIFLAGLFTYTDYKGHYKISVLLKSGATLLIILLSIKCFVYKNLELKIYFYYIFIGLCFGLLGDFLLSLENISKNKKVLFLTGLVAFLFGHLFYIMAFSQIHPIGIIDFVLTGLYLGIAYFVFTKSDLDLDSFKYGVLMYACVISFMLSKATTLLIFSPNFILGCVAFIGALLFVLSDSLLSFSVFGDLNKDKFSLCCHILYFPAQIILALSILFVS